MKRRLHPYRNTTSTNVPRRLMTPKLPARWRLRAWHRNPAPQSRTAKSAPPKAHRYRGCVRGTKIRHHSHTWPSRPPQKPTQTEVARVAPKSGTTVTHGQVGPPTTSHNDTEPKSDQRCGGNACGTEIRHHKHAWPNRPSEKPKNKKKSQK